MTTAELARAYFAALNAHDLDAATALWRPGAIDRLVGGEELPAPDGVRRYFGELLAAFPDFQIEPVELTTAKQRTAVRWRASGTFAGPGRFQGFAPTGARMEIEGVDVITVEDELIVHNDAFLDSGDVARQLGLLPAAGSPTERRVAALANVRSRVGRALAGSEAEPVADGVWVVRGGVPLRTMNVYLIADGGQVTVFDGGVAGMESAVLSAAARLGGIERVVLGHADVDHRGAVPGLRAPVYCHAAERAAAEQGNPRRDYHDPARLRAYARPFYRVMLPAWNGGPVEIEGTVAEGDAVAGFRVVDTPGHAPGQIALWRDSDRLLLCSDTVYTLDVQTGLPGGPRVAHAAFDLDVEQARASVRKVAELDPAAVWPGHAGAVTRDVAAALARAADGPVAGERARPPGA